jgi:acetyltransferase-like isoleucine patch superfamily enzyme
MLVSARKVRTLRLPHPLDPRTFRRRHSGSAYWHWLVNGLAASPAVTREQRRRLLRLAGIRTESAIVEDGVYFFGADATLGAWSLVSHGCYLENRAHIAIGDGCALGMGVTVLTATHDIGGRERRAGPFTALPVTVGDGTWVGARSVVLPGVTIAPGCVIAAGSVVTADTEPDGLYAGVPAARRRDL